MSELKKCPFCGGEATIDNAGGKYQAWCKHCCCIHMGEFYNTEAEAIAAWNRRAQPENSRQHALQTGVCPMCEDCPDGCPIEAPKDSRNKMTNAQRIRGMSDAQHARFLVHVVSDGCPPDMDWDCQKDKDGWDACDKCWEKWLQQPAETEGTE